MVFQLTIDCIMNYYFTCISQAVEEHDAMMVYIKHVVDDFFVRVETQVVYKTPKKSFN